MAHSSEIQDFRNFVESFTKERSLHISISVSEDGEGLVFRTKGKKDIVVNLQTNIRNENFLRDVAKFFSIDHGNKKSWPHSFTKWVEARGKASAISIQAPAKECFGPSVRLSTTPPPSRPQSLEVAATHRATLGAQIQPKELEGKLVSSLDLKRAEAIANIYYNMTSIEISAFQHHFIDIRCGQHSPKSNPNAHRDAYKKLSAAFFSSPLTNSEWKQLINAVTVYVNAPASDRALNRAELFTRMAMAMASSQHVEVDFEAIASRRRSYQKRKALLALSKS